MTSANDTVDRDGASSDRETPPRRSVNRRRFLAAGAGTVGAIGLGAVLSGCDDGNQAAAATTDPDDGSSEPRRSDDVVDFYGDHQAGITTAAQDRLYFAAFDVITDDADELRRLLERWTEAAAQMAAGQPTGETGAVDGPPLAPPEDTGEALGLPPAHLTITFGFGPSLFVDESGADRFGLAARQPDALRPLPRFALDRLDPASSGGDLCVQACADDPQVAFHAVRNLARIGFGTVSLRWSQLGFGRTSSTTTTQQTPRNLFGFKDGTANLKAEESSELDVHLWVQPDDDPGASWLDGGTYLVARRIAMHIETWDRSPLAEQERVIGRTKASGAPLSGGDEFTEPDFSAVAADGSLAIPPDSHVAMAHPSANGGTRILRRGYNFTDGSNGLGRLDAGLFFVAFMRDPRQFIDLQERLARDDLLSEYLVHTGSALFAIPPGATETNPIGAALFA